MARTLLTLEFTSVDIAISATECTFFLYMTCNSISIKGFVFQRTKSVRKEGLCQCCGTTGSGTEAVGSLLLYPGAGSWHGETASHGMWRVSSLCNSRTQAQRNSIGDEQNQKQKLRYKVQHVDVILLTLLGY